MTSYARLARAIERVAGLRVPRVDTARLTMPLAYLDKLADNEDVYPACPPTGMIVVHVGHVMAGSDWRWRAMRDIGSRVSV